MLHGEVGHANGDANGDTPTVPPPPYAVALTAGGKVLRFPLAHRRSRISTRKGRYVVVRLDAGFKDDVVVGVEATDGSETVCLATRSARVLIFPVTEANVVAGTAKGVIAIKLDTKDRVLGFSLANKMREGLTVTTNRGRARSSFAPPSIPSPAVAARATASSSGGVLLEAIVYDEAKPVPPVEEVGDSADE